MTISLNQALNFFRRHDPLVRQPTTWRKRSSADDLTKLPLAITVAPQFEVDLKRSFSRGRLWLRLSSFPPALRPPGFPGK
jgi:hypothetical protein